SVCRPVWAASAFDPLSLHDALPILNFTRALQHAAGVGRMMNGYEEITKANVLLLIGTDITETNPVASLRVKEAFRVYGAQVIVATSRLTNIAKLASHPLRIAAGSERWCIP